MGGSRDQDLELYHFASLARSLEPLFILPYYWPTLGRGFRIEPSSGFNLGLRYFHPQCWPELKPFADFRERSY